MDAIEYFQRQRLRLDQLFEQLAQVRAPSEREELVARLYRAVRFHELLTERFLFPILQPHLVDRSPLQEAHEEHAVLAWTLRSLVSTHPTDPRHEPLVHVLERFLHAHCDREEQLLFLPQRGVLNRTELNSLGRQFEAVEQRDRPSEPPPAPREPSAPSREPAPRARWAFKRPTAPAPFRHRTRPGDAR